MGNRLSKIYTRTGDQGTTGLGDGSRTDKDSTRVEAFGSVDELNALIGMLLTHSEVDAASSKHPLTQWLLEIQHDLFDLGSELCIPGHSVLNAEFVDRLEQQIDALNQDLPPLKEFVLPGGSPAAAASHMARTVCRRTERRAFTLSRTEAVNEWGLKYLNRLSDWLFVVSRTLARSQGNHEILWNRQRLKA